MAHSDEKFAWNTDANPGSKSIGSLVLRAPWHDWETPATSESTDIMPKKLKNLRWLKIESIGILCGGIA
jgi:hypothetical protein